MSFGSGGFGGFGSSNNNQSTTTGFGGFGASNNTTNNTAGGFGSSGNTGFGTGNTNSGGSLFGGNNTTSTGFGSGGFGANNTSSGFGARPFGSASGPSGGGGSLFGGNTASTGNTGFGAFGSTTTQSTGFGATTGTANTGGGLFGNAGSTGFGSSTGSGGGLFGNQNQSTGFGGTSTSAFGQSTSTGFGSSQPQNNGTGGTPFQPFTEKDQSGSANQTQHYQSITCQPAYANFSFEELRTVDYLQGRKYGNQSGQAGAFGQNTGFGGFGTSSAGTSTGFGATSGGGLFGSTSSTAPAGGFGTGTSTGTGFGSNTSATGGGIFGARPASSGLFGAPATSTQQSGGLFGTATNTSTGFGQSSTGGFGSTTGTGLFGQQQSNNQAKAGGLFGQPSAGNTFGQSSTGFGQQASNTGGNLFGNNATTGAFGATQQQGGQTNSLFGGFGQQQAQNQGQNQANQQGGGLFGGFGNQNQQKPSLFGSTPAAGNPFGQNNQQAQPQNQGGGLFGNNNQQQGGGLFGQPKPNLFGSAPAPAGQAGGPFANLNNQNQQNQGTGLFGQNQNQAKPSLFSTNTTANTGGGLFGNLGQGTTNQPNAGSSLFPNNNQTQPQLGSSLFGNSQPNQQQQQQQQQLSTSIASNMPYGNEHLFISLATPPQAVGPLATPLSSSQKARKPAPLPTYKLSPAATSRLLTPKNRSGYGFDYSSYGTPGSAFSNASPPIYGRSLLGGGSLGRSLGKSLSTNNLRSAYNAEESILSPGAFSASGMSKGGSGNLKKLKINRSLRTDLFGADNSGDAFRASPLKKTVTFEPHVVQKDNEANHDSSGATPDSSNALVRVEESESPTPGPEEQGFLRTSRIVKDDSAVNGTIARTEMEQVKGNELAVVPEDETPSPPAPAPLPKASMSAAEKARMSQKDMPPGEYYMIPSKAELEKMSRKARSHVAPFTVGRENTGKIEFDNVDLSNVDLDKICGDIVNIETRSATVYANHKDKPSPGKGMNRPALVTLDNSWPRAKGGKLPVYERKGPRFDKHLERLKRVDGTEFVKYDVEMGQWIFRVPHFSTYALDYSDDEDMGLPSPSPSFRPSRLPTLSQRSEASMRSHDVSLSNDSETQDSELHNTFEFRNSRSVPGAFDDDVLYGDSGVEEYPGTDLRNPRLESTAIAPSGIEDYDVSSELGGEPLMSGAIPSFDGALDDDSPEKHAQALISPIKPTALSRSTRHAVNGIAGTPFAAPVTWADRLGKTLSPKKQDRQALRESQGQLLKEKLTFHTNTSIFDKQAHPFATSIDVMNSLFGQDNSKGGGGKQTGIGKGFQWPYAKRPIPDANEELSEADRAFHASFKPSWAFDGTFIYSATDPTSVTSGPKAEMAFDGNDNRFGCFAAIIPSVATATDREQQSLTHIFVEESIPRAELSDEFSFGEFAEAVVVEDAQSEHEMFAWRLASVLFDPIDTTGGEEMARKKNFSRFWLNMVKSAMEEQYNNASKDGSGSTAQQALILLSANCVHRATESLLNGGNFRLSTMIAQIGGADPTSREDMAVQIEEWRRNNTLSEISPAIRALYELLAGNTCTSRGKTGAGSENHAETFGISSKFGFDWRRSFALKLCYGMLDDDPLAKAIELYMKDLAAFREEVRPVPWFVERNADTGWDDPHRQERQDILFGLLKIYALTQVGADDDGFLESRVKLADIISPQNVAGNPVDSRLSFKLYHTLSRRGIIDFPDVEQDHKANLLATDYAFQLAGSSSNICDAVFVTLHLTEPSAREAAVKALLNRHAGAIGGSPNECPTFNTLVQNLKIPASWIWTAKALYAKGVLADETLECKLLLYAGEVAQAHDVLQRSVAPRCIIEEDYPRLRELLAQFDAAKATELRDWELGGGIYRNYLKLMDVARHSDKTEIRNVVAQLAESLDEVATVKTLEERVAVSEMVEGTWKIVRDVSRLLGGADLTKELSMPRRAQIADDRMLEEAKKLSESFYASVQA